MEKKVYNETRKLIEKNFQLPERMNSGEEDFFDREKLELILSEQISWYLENRFEQLMQIFYRLDIDENQVKKILTNPSDRTSHDLAVLVVEREIKRAKTRIKYSGRF